MIARTENAYLHSEHPRQEFPMEPWAAMIIAFIAGAATLAAAMVLLGALISTGCH